jgi:alkyldihydroxyacetonephosphate synthase
MDLDASFEKALPSLARSSSPPDAISYARDLWPRHHLAVREGRIAEHRPGLIVWPQTTEEVASVVRFCAAEGVPLVPFGAGSGVCGGVLPDPRTVVLDLKRMNRARSIDEGAPLLRVEAGALGIRLEEDLNARGFTLGHFPSSILCSTVGGWVAARSAGQCSGRYGKIEDMVASLECVVGRGEIVELKRRVHGPDLTNLIIGSEGVLGVVTAASLRLHPAPKTRVFSSFSFPTIEAGWSAMREMFQRGLRPAVARLYDPFDSFIARRGLKKAQRRPHGKSSSKKRPAPGGGAAILRGVLRAPSLLNQMIDVLSSRVFRGSMLVLIWEESDAGGDGRDELSIATEIAARFGARPLGEAPARRWLDHRYSVSYRQAPIFMAGAFSDTMEVAAPWSRLGALYEAVREAIGEHAFVMAHLSHAYPDGCSIYFTFVGSSPSIPDMERRYDAAWKAALDAAIAAGGTLSHHHGVGRSKAPKLGGELGLGVDIVHALRGAFDPAGILNPGNLLPREAPARRAPAPPPASPELDLESLLIRAGGDASLASIERALSSHGLSLGLGPGAPPLDSTTVDAWIAAGARGAPDPWADPVDHLVAGFTARLPSGAELEVRSAPRRAVGPDLFALFLGTNGRAGSITSVHLRAHRPYAPRPLPFTADRDPAQTSSEQAWIDRALETAAGVR